MIDAAPESKLTMSVQEMAYQLGIGRNKAYELVKQRDFPAVRIGGNYRVIADKLPDWLNKQPGKPTISKTQTGQLHNNHLTLQHLSLGT